MKKWFFILLCCFSAAVFSKSNALACLKWKKVCHQKQECVYRNAGRNGCFRCVKPNHYGFHLYPQQIDRNTCNLKSVHYFQTMGYRCYQPKNSQTCVKNTIVKKCYFQCVQYLKEKVR